MNTTICNNFSFKLLKITKILGECYTFVLPDYAMKIGRINHLNSTTVYIH